MKTSCELQKKLNKLPDHIITGSPEKERDWYSLNIMKTTTGIWQICYTSKSSFDIIWIQHQSLQTAVDNTLASLKKIK